MKLFTKLRDMAEAKSGDAKQFPGIMKSTAFQVDPRIMEVEEGFNARPIDQDHVDALKKSWRAGATIPPCMLKVIDSRIIVRDGHHRREMYLQLIAEGEDIRLVDAIEFKGNDTDAILLLCTSSQGKSLTPLQAGLQYAKLIRQNGMTATEIAEKVGKSAQHVGQMLMLAETDSDVQAMVARDEVKAHVALAVVKEHGSGAAKVLADSLAKAKDAGKTKVTKKTVEDQKEKPKSLVDAIKAEMITGGGVKAEDLCPKHADLIEYLRASGLQLRIPGTLASESATAH